MSDPQPVAERPAPAIRRQAGGEPRLALERSLFVLMAFIICLIVGLIAAHLVAVRSDVLDRAEKNAANLGQAFEEHLAISIGLLNDTLLAMRSQSFIRDSEQLRAGLRSRPGLNDIALQVAVAATTWSSPSTAEPSKWAVKRARERYSRFGCRPEAARTSPVPDQSLGSPQAVDFPGSPNVRVWGMCPATIIRAYEPVPKVELGGPAAGGRP